MMPPPGWTALGELGGNRGRAVAPAEQELVEGGEHDARDGAVLDRRRPRRAAVALRQAGPVGEVVARSPRRGTRSSGGRARPARPRGRTRAGSDERHEDAVRREHDAALHRGAREQVDDRLALDRDAVGGEVLLELGARRRARAPRSARPRARPAPRSRRAASAAARSSPPSAARTAGAATRGRAACTRCSVVRISHVIRMPCVELAAAHRAARARACARPAPAPPAGGAGRRRRARAATGRAPGASPHSPASNAATTRFGRLQCATRPRSAPRAAPRSTASSRTSTAG